MNATPPTPKFQIGQTVYYVNSYLGEKEATVTSVVTGWPAEAPIILWEQPIYTIQWLPTGCASVPESELSTTPRRKEDA